MNVLQGVHKHWWQGLAIVLSSLSAGVPCFSGLGRCFLWGRDKIVVWIRLHVNLVVCMGGLGREYAVISVWRRYLHMYVVLCITVSVSLFSVRFLRCALRCHYVCVVSLVWSCMAVSPCCVYYNCYHCVSMSRRRMLLILRFLDLVVYLS